MMALAYLHVPVKVPSALAQFVGWVPCYVLLERLIYSRYKQLGTWDMCVCVCYGCSVFYVCYVCYVCVLCTCVMGVVCVLCVLCACVCVMCVR